MHVILPPRDFEEHGALQVPSGIILTPHLNIWESIEDVHKNSQHFGITPKMQFK